MAVYWSSSVACETDMAVWSGGDEPVATSFGADVVAVCECVEESSDETCCLTDTGLLC